MGLDRWGKVAHSCLQSVSCPFRSIGLGSVWFWAWLLGGFPVPLLEVETYTVLILRDIYDRRENRLQCTAEFVLKEHLLFSHNTNKLFFVLLVFITTQNMSCISINPISAGGVHPLQIFPSPSPQTSADRLQTF